MDDVAGIGADFAVGIDVGHDIVAPASFVRLGPREIDVLDMGAELLDLGRRDSRRDAVSGQ
jgi:hypothetical protein